MSVEDGLPDGMVKILNTTAKRLSRRRLIDHLNVTQDFFVYHERVRRHPRMRSALRMIRGQNARVERGMRQIGETTARAFKALAGVEKDKPMASWVFALYGFLFCIAFMLVLTWVMGPPA